MKLIVTYIVEGKHPKHLIPSTVPLETGLSAMNEQLQAENVHLKLAIESKELQ